MPKTKYRKWIESIANARNWDVNEMLNDPTYNYEHFFNTNPIEANAMLKRNANAHFTDVAKTAYHPTFSVESDYSGIPSIHNPKGIIGGKWSTSPNLGKNASRYTLSESQMKHNWDVDNTINYLIDAEDNGVELLLPNGRRLYTQDGIFGGVLPEIIVTKTKYKK